MQADAPRPHIPAWLEDVANHLVIAHEAEAIFLVGSQARGTATPASDYDLLVLVDNEQVHERGLSPRYRWEVVEGFPGMVEFLRASMAELMAGAYSASPPWVDLLESAYPLHDPVDCKSRLDAQRAAARTPGTETLLQTVRASAERAAALHKAGSQAAAHLAALRIADELASWVTRQEGGSPLGPLGVAESIANLSPGAARAFAEVLQAADADERLEALTRFINAVESTMRLRH